MDAKAQLSHWPAMTEATFRTDVLIPLLAAMGYRDVDHFHGPDELGKDVVAWREEEDGAREYVAVVAKVGAVGASATGDAATVGTQVRQAFGSVYTDKTTGEERGVHRVIVATTGKIREASRKAVLTQLDGQLRRHVRFWDGSKVHELTRTYFPEPTVPQSLTDVYEKLSDLEHFDVEATVGREGVTHRIESKGGPVTVASGVFSFPETPEGASAREDWDRYFDEGGTVTVPGEFIESFDLHDELTGLYGNVRPDLLQLGPQLPGDPIPFYVEVGPAPPSRYDGLALRAVRSGRRRIELQSDHVGEPLHFTAVLTKTSEGETAVSATLGIHLAGHKARRARQAARVWARLAAGAKLRTVEDATGRLLLPEGPFPAEPLHDGLMTYLDELALIEERFNLDLWLPETIRDRDVLDAQELCGVLRDGAYVEPFETYTVTVTPEMEVDLLESFPPGETRWLYVETGEGKYEILGHTLPLGPSSMSAAVVLSGAEHERVREQVKSGASSVEMIFHSAPGSEGVYHHYKAFKPVG